jgi:hypothetical protein
MNLVNNVVGGNLYTVITLDKSSKIDLRMKITDKFEIITKNLKQADVYRSLLESNDISEKFKKTLLEKNAMNFSKLEANLEVKNNILEIERFLLKGGENGSMGLSGFGKCNLSTGNVEIDGLIIPFDTINTIFGMNKIPLINNLLFQNKDGGLITIAYKFKKASYEENSKFKIIPSSVASPNFMKNILLAFLLL